MIISMKKKTIFFQSNKHHIQNFQRIPIKNHQRNSRLKIQKKSNTPSNTSQTTPHQNKTIRQPKHTTRPRESSNAKPPVRSPFCAPPTRSRRENSSVFENRKASSIRKRSLAISLGPIDPRWASLNYRFRMWVRRASTAAHAAFQYSSGSRELRLWPISNRIGVC